jgi:hypothetical protein
MKVGIETRHRGVFGNGLETQVFEHALARATRKNEDADP